jgi:hypothetical protein
MVGVDVSVAPSCATGDDYLLTREADGWMVRTAIVRWVS